MTFVTLCIHNLTSPPHVLTGVMPARRLLADFVSWTAQHAPKGVMVIDFDGVSTASASFLRESVLAFRDYARSYQPELFPVVANLSDTIREEFALLLAARGEAILCCRVD